MKGSYRLPARFLLSGMAAAALTLPAFLASTSAPAQAATSRTATVAQPATAGQYCGTYGSGLTGAQEDGGYSVETVWHKQPPGCHDFNLVYADADGYCPSSVGCHRGYDNYLGAYESGNTWVAGANGWHELDNGNVGDVVLLTAVATGTALSIESDDYGDEVHVNY